MMEFLQAHQLNFMLALSAACGTVALFVLVAKAIPTKRRRALLGIELSSMFLLYFDRLAYMYSGDTRPMGYVMVRVTNFLVFSLTLVVIITINNYLIDILANEGGLAEVPVRLRITNVICVVGILLIVFSQFTGLYYYFDEANRYQRGPGFILCYLFPLLAPILILTVIIQYRERLSRPVRISIYIFIIAPMVASIIQIYAYGLSLTNITIVGAAAVVYIVALVDINKKLEIASKSEIDFLREEHEKLSMQFLQTISAFVNAIDERDRYKKGHSVRVAEYAKMIAKTCGMNDGECEQIFYTALLHEVGKLGISDSILLKRGDLSDEENEQLKMEPIIGDKILSRIADYPFLRLGARYVHERYDGSGYPDGLKGEDIPKSARIIAVADLYDEMTTYRQNRDPYPQIIVREELLKYSGTQLDPRFAAAMVAIMDEDRNYDMKQGDLAYDKEPEKEFDCSKYRSHVSKGILIEETVTGISFECSENKTSDDDFSSPSIIVYDSYDGRVHDDPKMIEVFRFIEYCEAWFDGHYVSTAVRDMQVEVTDIGELGIDPAAMSENSSNRYEVTAGRFEDHVRIMLIGGGKTFKIILALPDSSKYAYVALTGEHCSIKNIKTERTQNRLCEADIPRIVSPVSYIDKMVGDVPNIQINRTRSASTEGLAVENGMRLIFHTMSLPSAHLVWHCPYVVLYSSDDNTVGGPNYKEYALLKMNGENECTDAYAENSIKVVKTDEFKGWDRWKEVNKRGLEIEVTFFLKRNTVVMSAEDGGIIMENTTVIKDMPEQVYVALTGDECALTDIRIKK